MRASGVRYPRWCVALATGGVTLGVLQGLGMVSFASILTTLLAQWLSAIVTVLLGGDPSQVFGA